MIPILYSSTETTFTSEGLGRLTDCTRCYVTEERNGVYECEFNYPVDSGMFNKITEGCIVSCIHDDSKTKQPFVIYGRSEPLNGIVTFYAHHISYELMNVILQPFTATNAADALSKIPQKSLNTNRFTYWTDRTLTANFSLDKPMSVKSILGGVEGSILDAYGPGEYEWDKFAVKFHTNRGIDTGIQIRYGKNLTAYDRDYAIDELYNAIVPYYINMDGGIVTLPEWFIYASGVNASNAKPVPMDLSDKFDDTPTVEQLRNKASSIFNKNTPWAPDENIKISFVSLGDTIDYQDLQLLERIKLCDTVDIYFAKYGITAYRKKVIKVKYDVLLERYDSIELGKSRTSFAESIMASTDEKIKDIPTRSFLDTAVDNATQLITGAKGGNMRSIYDSTGNWTELVVMNTDNILTATKLWRFNLGGFGYSPNGYNGPYTTAITMDGAIVADFITTGTLNAALAEVINLDASNISTGTLSANRIAANSIAVSKLTGSISNGDWKIDLDAGTFSIGEISANKITTGTLSADRIAANSIAVAKLTGSITGGLSNSWEIDLTAGTLTIGNISAANITTGTLSADRIGAGSITADKITVTNLQSISASLAGWTVSNTLIRKTTDNYDMYFQCPANPADDSHAINVRKKINGSFVSQFLVRWDGSLTANNATIRGSVTATSGTIGGVSISNGVLTGIQALNIADNTITNGKIASNTITNGKIADLTLTDAKIASNTITNGSMLNNTLQTGKMSTGINTSLGKADYSDDVFSGNQVSDYLKTRTLQATNFTFNNSSISKRYININGISYPVLGWGTWPS